MSPRTSIPVFPISAVIAVTFLDSDPAGCTTLAASLSFISCFGLRCDCAELITFPTLGSAFDPSRYDTTQDRSMPSTPLFTNPPSHPAALDRPTYTAIYNVLATRCILAHTCALEKWGRKVEVHNEGLQIFTLNMPRSESTSGDRTKPEAVSHRLPCSYKAKQRSGPGSI